jgi:hypothetical protein
MNVVMRDVTSGLKRMSAVLETVGGNSTELHTHEFTMSDLDNTSLQKGELFKALSACSNELHCDENGFLKMNTLQETAYTLTLRVEDVAGNVISKEVYFQVQTLRSSIIAWRQNVLSRNSDNDLAQTRLDNATEKLELALTGFDSDYYGNMLLALEDAQAKIREAGVFDPDSNFTVEALLVAQLAHEFVDRLLGEYRADFGNNDSFDEYNRASGFLSEADASVGLSQSGDAFLGMANAYFWMEEGKRPYEGISCSQAHSTATDILSKLGVYVNHNTELPGSDELGDAHDTLSPVVGFINRYIQDFCRSRALNDREHVELILGLTTVAEQLKDAENQTAWVRNFQWGMTNVTYYFAERGLNNAATFFDEDNQIIAQGFERLERATEMKDEYRADDFMDLLKESRCTTIAIYNLSYVD